MDLAWPQSPGMKRMDSFVLGFFLENSASARSRRVCAAIRFLRPCVVMPFGGMPCWQIWTNHPSEGSMPWMVPA